MRAQLPINNWPGRTHRHLQEGTLCRTLQRLTQTELIAREREVRFPFSTTYRLTPPSREILTAMAPAATWAESHAELLVRAQRGHRTSGE
ncbi:winged helix-turn-helix transcriptional regulator [Streptomyces sp. AN091965]|uniref:winged helix-turn-helix transcriptional regulator n=1 Tax=Streptomyces sp. AN091965 TaxID=2927803 RepID=UPI001F60C887|nr:winged helix-turn-helix transcriptional regulator [Streptomyces sp. AN091965]MCI3928838.1 winged helix-turn-helix transcriptional regulator [Streptomyces sp. AN091965]